MSLAVLTNLLKPGQPLYDYLVTDLNRSPSMSFLALGIRADIVGRFLGAEFQNEKLMRPATKESLAYLATSLGKSIFSLAGDDLTTFVRVTVWRAESWIERHSATPRT